jgi:hypothetical protein
VKKFGTRRPAPAGGPGVVEDHAGGSRRTPGLPGRLSVPRNQDGALSADRRRRPPTTGAGRNRSVGAGPHPYGGVLRQ